MPEVRTFVMLLLIAMLDCTLWPSSVCGEDRAAVEHFRRSVAPVLVELCTQCHNPRDQFAGLDLTTRERTLAGGDAGAVLELGRPERSLLLSRIADGSMPPEEDGRRLSELEVEAFRVWIRDGLAFDERAISGTASPNATQPAVPGYAACSWQWQRRPVPSLRTRGSRLGSATRGSSTGCASPGSWLRRADRGRKSRCRPR